MGELHGDPPELRDHCAVHLRQEGEVLLALLGQTQQHLRRSADLATERRPVPRHYLRKFVRTHKTFRICL